MEGLNNELNSSTTENGARGYRSTNSPLVDFNFKVSSYRNMSENEIIGDFSKILDDKDTRSYALKFLFYIRDIRGGLGERRLFKVILNHIVRNESLMDFSQIMPLIAEYGRFDDLYILLDSDKGDFVKPLLKYIDKKLKEDIKSLNENKSVSLLAKWLPSENASSERTKKYAKIIRKHCYGNNAKAYRQILSQLRNHIDVVEKKMSANKWNEIKYEGVPSKANLIYKDAFLEHDEERRNDYLQKVEDGKAKINSSALFPHEIIAKYSYKSGVDSTFEELWKALPNYVAEDSSTIVVADGSGSMYGARSGKVDAIHVAMALAIYFSERCKGAYKDKFITFSENPRLINLSHQTCLRAKIEKAYSCNEVANTNIKKVFDLLLKTAVANEISQEEIPNILIISDMEFDEGTCCRSEEDANKLIDEISDKWAQSGYRLPRLSYWNVASRTQTIPQIKNQNGLSLISGFSPTVLKSVLSDKNNPLEQLLDILSGERYDKVPLIQ
jgi:hypothetical protein